MRVESECVVDGAILGKGVKVLRGSRIEKGCLVADGVVLGPGANLKRLTRVSAKRAGKSKSVVEDEDEDEDSEIEDVEAGRLGRFTGHIVLLMIFTFVSGP